MCEEEALQARAVIGHTSNSVHDLVNDLFADGVVTTCVVISSVLLTSDELFRVKQVSVLASANFVYYIGFKIDVDGSRYVFAGA